ncbi:MAG TPA: hypothetical protein VEF34_15050 [Syntrophobacteraceae bacterium]|nr:hypothetical protein [Syntrophobacteraceae bacterium]
MTKRETIILAATAAAVVAGAVYFLTGRLPEVSTGVALIDFKALQDFASRTEEAEKKALLSEGQVRILELASTEWASDPFLGKKLTAAKPASPKAGETHTALAYTGFVIAGQARLAVINGMEYQVGEVVLGSELVVQAISPQNVVVKQLNGPESFSVPFTGEVLR